MRQPTIKQIMSITGLSRATVDRVLNHREGTSPRTVQAVTEAISRLKANQIASSEGAQADAGIQAFNCALVIQTGEAFASELKRRVDRLLPELAALGIRMKVAALVDASDQEVVSYVQSLSADVEGIAIICKHCEALSLALKALKERGIGVVTLVTDLPITSRHCYVGMNNRSAGQAAGFLIGKHLQSMPSAKVAVVVGAFSYSCHEDREIGFRTTLRQHFPNTQVMEVIQGDDRTTATYEATTQLLREHDDLDAVYNVAGGNDGLTKALSEHGLLGKTIVVAHDTNEINDRLVREGGIDYLITQDLDALVRTTAKQLRLACEGKNVTTQTLPIAIGSRFTLQ